MKKSKIFLTTGTLVLAIPAIFAAKTSKKFNSATEARAGSLLVFQGTSSILMTTKSGGTSSGQMSINSTAQPTENLVTAVNNTNDFVYLKP